MVRTVLSHYSGPVLISITQPFSQLARVTTHRVGQHEEDIPLSLLHLDVLGPPEVFHDGSRLTFSLRNALALLVYLSVEGCIHPRSKRATGLSRTLLLRSGASSSCGGGGCACSCSSIGAQPSRRPPGNRRRRKPYCCAGSRSSRCRRRPTGA